MTVKEIFALRKQGRIEEAYEAIRPIYREHKGRFTSLCMFWVASDVFKLRLEQGRVEEARKICEAMKRILPSIEDDEQAAEREQARPQVRDKKKREVIPSDVPSDTPHVIPSEVEESREISPCTTLSRDDSALSPGQQAVLECVKANPGVKVPGIEAETGIPAKSVNGT